MLNPLHGKLRTALAAALSMASLSLAPVPALAQAGGAAALTSGPAGQVTAGDMEMLIKEMVPAGEIARFWASRDAVVRFARSAYVQRALSAEAAKAGLDKTPEGTAYLKMMHERALMELQLRQGVRTALPNEQALDRYARSEYQAQPDRFKEPEQVNARHILLAVAQGGGDDAEVKAKAEALRAELVKGADFAQLAREQSADPGSATRGGELGFFAAGRMAPAFEKAAFALKKPGELSELVKTPFGYHIIQLVERKPARTVPFEEVLPKLREELRTKIEGRERSRLWESADTEAKVNDEAVNALMARHPTHLGKP
ncbi:peptidylprolyl isomerase [Ottowia sp.]|uniref:peptidylprolyl isomerase n=1 Tax=Ottowia sp. TaxID=1898956 RepID=UPI0025EB54D9|nr:peptidylprolyl isomerase [Ottowia sp.]MBK6614407.1 peptidyl-prolyl cis-trans isomerase [Ottowia sp.]MBK6745039.1 peptidyl-prolyl cis-trans isomerase [Ottowia sp.]